MQIIPRGQNFFGELGTGLGELAGLKLGQLVKQHEQKKERSQFAEQFAPILGKDTANFLSNLSPEERKYALQNVSSLIQLNEPPSSREQASQLGGLHSMQQLAQNNQQQPQQNQLQQALQQYFNNPTLGQQQGYDYSQGQQQPEQQQLQPQQQTQNQQQLTPERAKLIEDLLLSPQEKRERQKLEFAREKEDRAERRATEKEARVEQLAADKETKKYFENALELEKAADFSDIRLGKMENLIKKGGLPVSGFYNLFKSLEESVSPAYGAAAGAAAGGYTGGPIGAAIGSAIGGLISPVGTLLRFAQRKTSPNTEEFEKLSNDFIKDAKTIFGSRITDADLKAFMATIPTLGQTDEGKLAIINNMKMFNKGSRIRAEAVKDAIRENDNRRPANLQLIVEDRIRPQLDRLAEEFSVV
jgi:flagellar motor protein MotB